MQTLDVKYTDRIHGFQGRLLKVVTKAELKIELGRSAAVRDADCEAKRTIKGHRFVFRRNEENLDAKGLRILGELEGILGYWDFGMQTTAPQRVSTQKSGC